MEIIWIAAAAAASSGAAFLAAFLRTRKLTHIIQYSPQTKVEIFFEQKELSRWLIMEVTTNLRDRNPSKEHIAEILGQLHILYQSAKLTNLSNIVIRQALEAADTALHVAENIDRRYMFLLNKLVEAVVAAVLRASGDKEPISYYMKTSGSLKGLAGAFRLYGGGADQIEQWKDDAMKKRPKQQ